MKRIFNGLFSSNQEYYSTNFYNVKDIYKILLIFYDNVTLLIILIKCHYE